MRTFLVIGLEAKYPHYGGKIGKAVANKMGLFDPPKSASQPAGIAKGRDAK